MLPVAPLASAVHAAPWRPTVTFRGVRRTSDTTGPIRTLLADSMTGRETDSMYEPPAGLVL